MFSNLKALTLIFCCYIVSLVNGGDIFKENVSTLDAIVPYQVEQLLHRDKRGGGGGGFIPFRPLFIYRQQQRKKQEKWKEIEARKILQQQSSQQYQETIQQNQELYQSHRPLTAPSYYSQPTTQYYPSSIYESYYPTYYGRYPYYYNDYDE